MDNKVAYVKILQYYLNNPKSYQCQTEMEGHANRYIAKLIKLKTENLVSTDQQRRNRMDFEKNAFPKRWHQEGSLTFAPLSSGIAF